jgi:hypothetical protein
MCKETKSAVMAAEEILKAIAAEGTEDMCVFCFQSGIQFSSWEADLIRQGPGISL